MTRLPILPRPFNDPKSFTAVACRTERITIKPEWASHYPSGLQSDKEKPEQTQTKEARNG